MSEILKSIYDSIVDSKDSIVLPYQNNDEIIYWIPILNNDSDTKNVGISQYGEWVINGRNRFIIINNYKSYLFCLPLLETPIEKLINNLNNFFNTLFITYDIFNIFPFVEIIKFALEYEKNDYWLNLAFNWYDKLENSKKIEFKSYLENIKNNKYISQKFRHKAVKEIKRIREYSNE